MINKFDIGLYDDGLVSSSRGFFRTGVTNESLKETGKHPVARNGVSRSETALSIDTGRGSVADDLSGRRAMAAVTFSDANDANSVNAALVGVGH